MTVVAKQGPRSRSFYLVVELLVVATLAILLALASPAVPWSGGTAMAADAGVSDKSHQVESYSWVPLASFTVNKQA